MFKRLRHIGNFRIYNNWSDAGTPASFERVNLVFGSNGSGKSTLAEMFQAGVEGVLPVDADVRLDWENASGNTEVITDSTHDAWARVHVFNKAYVMRSLRFEAAEGPSPDALLTLGEQNVQAEIELETKRAHSVELRTEREELRRQLATSEKALNEHLRSAAQSVVTQLGRAATRYRASNVYNITQVRALLQSDRDSLKNASTDPSSDLDVVTSSPLAGSVRVNRPDLSDKRDLDIARNLLKETVTVTAIEALRGDGRRSDWVQAGISLHANLDHCLFCGGPLTADRRHELDAHFDAALENLQRRIDSLVRKLNESSLNAEKHLDSLPRNQDLYAEILPSFEAAKAKYALELFDYQAAVANLMALLGEKRSNPFKTQTVADDIQLTLPDTASLEAALTQHDERSVSHASSVAAAARRLELRFVSDIAEKVDACTSDIDKVRLDLVSKDEEQRLTDQRILALADLESDPTPLAADLTESLARLLGRDELSFTTHPDRRSYRIDRAGSPATALSEGERTCIALLHFLARLRSSGIAASNPIVVVDDPVSSLDHNVMYGISSHLWSEVAVKMSVAQVFVLTHSFEMFRQWLIQLEGAKRRVGKSTVHELRVRNQHVGGKTRRVPTFEKWPQHDADAARLRSQYHYLFAQVGKAVAVSSSGASLMQQLDVLALAPNSARRMLEAFLSFKFPTQVGNFDASMREALQAISEGPIRTRIVRYVHSYSHNEDADIGKPLEPGEATAVLQSIFCLMKTLDSQHFMAMCRALGLDPQVLAGT
ncbi:MULTISPECIES: AAA family ATPase [unclassified Frigoribacterium]|uniref:AAA family ATPase n=1 Tax=unclassified Frigoribacterium TaxID=2627005 RepID=UPI0009E961F6|nr:MULTISPECIES: AAA family ATPase [unclassified Frigoribacterium]